MPQSDAQRKAKAKYDAKTYKVVTCKCKLSDYDKFQIYVDKHNISSMNSLLYKCVMYCIENDVDLSSDKLKKI